MTLARLLLIGAGALTYIYLPVAARLVRSDRREEIRASYVTSTRWIILFTLPLFLLFALLPGLSLSAVFGSSYEGGAVALAIIAWGSFVSTAVGPSAAALAGMGYARNLLVITSVSAATNLAASFALIPGYGLIGAAIAWTLARFVYTFGGSYALWRSDRITPLRRRLTLPVGVSLGVGIPSFLALGRLPLPDWSVVPLFFGAMGLFVGSILFTRSLDPGDLVAVSALERVLRRPLPRLRARLQRYVTRTERPTVVEAPPPVEGAQPNWPET
jgi:O-antigen/teichoic acid export membrane protein